MSNFHTFSLCHVALSVGFIAAHLSGHSSTAPTHALCYLSFVNVQVALCCSVPAHWLLLKGRLEKICPRSQGAQALWRWNAHGSEPLQHPFLMQVTSYNREGVLHGKLPIGCLPCF